MGSIIIKHFNKGVESLYGDYELCNEGDIQKTKDALLERMFGIIRDVAKKDEFWIVKPVDTCCKDSLSSISLPEGVEPPAVTVGWKAHFPQMEPEKDYKERMRDEYWETKRRYEKLHQMCIKYEAGTLDFEPSCSLELLTKQKAAMGQYLHCLEVRAQIEGVRL